MFSAGENRTPKRRTILQLDLKGVTDTQPSYRAQIVQSLTEFRSEWQEISKSKSLVEIEASVGLLLADIAERLGLSPQERHVMLGSKLVKQINVFIEEPVSVKLPS